MFQSTIRRCLSVLALCCAWPATVACSANAQGDQKLEQTGTLSLPLRVSVGDHVYRFGYFQVYIYPAGQVLSASDSETEAALTTQLPTGRYQASLQYWTLQRDDGQGNFVSVNASLVSSSYVSFEILNGSTTTVAFQFETDGQIITVGSGGLSVTAKIDERAPVCTPLGSDCGDGLWCPPAELTGAPLACRYAGGVALGSACAAPSDCVADSSCIDLGSGPVCAALCSAADFDTECATGGLCTAAGREYGVCTPAPAE